MQTVKPLPTVQDRARNEVARGYVAGRPTVKG